jgi:subtilisin family serine protease
LIPTDKTRFAELLEGVALEEPRYFFGPSMFPPLKKYWHLDVPAGVSLGCNADKAHRSGISGRGIRVAMVDSGHFKHPFFTARGYRVAPVVLGPGAANPTKDESGHGTGESANIFSVAPDVELLPVKINFVNSIGAFNAAVGLQPNIITCSWGSDKRPPSPLSAADLALAAAIASAVASGITVIFSAGNGHHGFPGQHPDVISAGGVFLDVDESLRASDYASSFLSHVYPGRRCPDLCGLVGMKPKAAYIMLPLEPNDDIDKGNAGGVHPNGDETANNDGWAAFSGTSAAAPQLAGAAALVKEACSKLTPAQIKDVLVKGARDVTTGKTNTATADGGNTAVAGPDLATGTGLVDAHKSVLLAKVKCLPIIIGPVPPIPVVGPPVVAPPVVGPPVVGPPIVAPPVVGPPVIGPPVIGPKPPQPVVGPQPPQPIVGPPAPGSEAAGPTGPAGSRLTNEDVTALQDLIIRSGLDE